MSRNKTENPPEVPYLQFREICGRGGTATVWRAWHLELKRDVAVKVLDADTLMQPGGLEQFQTEARALSCMDHPCIVKGYGAQYANGRYFYLMDFVGGYTLGAFLKRKVRIPEVDVLLVIQSVASALGYAWDTFRTVHCDLKPENLMVDSDGTVKIMDLGLAAEIIGGGAPGAAKPEPTEIIGTPPYMSPEQIYGDVELDCRSDIYSMGATAYHFATGRTLFAGMSADDIVRAHVAADSASPDPRYFAPRLSEPFVHLLARMVAKDPARRFQTWDAVADACDEIAAGRPVAPPPSGVSTSIELDPEGVRI